MLQNVYIKSTCLYLDYSIYYIALFTHYNLLDFPQLLSVLCLPGHQTDPPAPPSTAPAPGLCGTPGFLWGRLEARGPAGRGLGWEQPAWVLQGGGTAVWGLQARSDDTRG